MALRLDPAGFSAAKLRAAARAALEETASLLENPGTDRHGAIHEARKGLKRLRALYRLAGANDKAFRARENARLAAIARLLAGVREAAALAETAEWLTGHARTAEESALLARIAAAMNTRRDALQGAGMEDAMARAAHACREAMQGVDELCPPEETGRMARLLQRGWRRTLRKALRTLSPLTVDSPVEDFHALRKNVQTLHAYHGLLKPLWPQPLAARREKLAALIGTLGRENDLASLIALMAHEPRHFGAPIEQVILQRLIARRRQALRLHALQQAAALLDADPREDARRILILWKALS